MQRHLWRKKRTSWGVAELCQAPYSLSSLQTSWGCFRSQLLLEFEVRVSRSLASSCRRDEIAKASYLLAWIWLPISRGGGLTWSAVAGSGCLVELQHFARLGNISCSGCYVGGWGAEKSWGLGLAELSKKTIRANLKKAKITSTFYRISKFVII